MLTKDQVRLGRDEVKHVAKLANLPVSDQELEKYSQQLSKILEYIEQLEKVDTKNVEPTFNVSGQSNVLAKDEKGDCVISQEDALSNAPQKRDEFFVTKGVFQEE